MIGVVGKIKICYNLSGTQYVDVIDPSITSEFELKHCKIIKFRIEEITYIEDTIYEVTMSLLKPRFVEDEYLVDRSGMSFHIDEYGVSGNISLCF